MDGLIITHAENNLFRDIFTGKLHEPEYIQKIRGVYRRIADQIEKSLEKKDLVFYLHGGDEIAEEIRIFTPKMQIIGANSLGSGWVEKQFLETKEQVIDRNLEKIAIGGVSYEVCVQSLSHLFLGEDGSEISKDQYRKASKGLGWTPALFDEIFQTRLDARILEELTDKGIK